jgi:hypothetical protein
MISYRILKTRFGIDKDVRIALNEKMATVSFTFKLSGLGELHAII